MTYLPLQGANGAVVSQVADLTAATPVTSVLSGDELVVIRGGAAVLLPPGLLGGGAGAATLLSHTQAYIQPITIPTSNAVPYGVTLTTPNSCVFDATFGTGGTVPDNATLDKTFYFTNDEGDFVHNPASYPSQGASGNWRAVYRHYPAFESDGTTPDPANLHVMQTDRLSLIARTKVASSFDSSPFEMGYLRAPVGLTPGMYMELKCRWPSYSRDGISARWSWPTFWMFSTFQAFGGTSVEYPAHAMEIDVFDGYPEDNSRFGSSFPSGTPITPYGGDISQFQPVADVKVGAPGYRPGYSYEPDGTMRLYTDGPAQDPSLNYHVYGFDWRDANNIYFLIDGVVVRHRKITTTAKRSDGSWQPFRIEVSHQYVSLFNPTDYPAADAIAAAGGSLRASYDVQYLRVWNSTTNAVDGPAYVVPTMPLGGPTLVGGQSFAFRSDIPSADQHTAGAGTPQSPLVLTSKVVGNNEYKVFFGTPWNGTGTRTILMRPQMPPQDNFSSAWGFYSSTNTANWVGMQNLYPKGYSGFGGCVNGSGTAFDLPDGSTSSYGNYDALGNYIPYFGRITRVGSNFIFSASRTGMAGSFTIVASVPASAVTSDYDTFGVFIDAKDNQSYGFPISVELSGYEATISVDPQAASGISTNVSSGSVPAVTAASVPAFTTLPASGTSQALTFGPDREVFYDITLTANCAFTVGAGVKGQSAIVILRGPFAWQSPPNTCYPNNSVPVPQCSASLIDIVQFTLLANGVVLCSPIALGAGSPSIVVTAFSGTLYAGNPITVAGTYVGTPPTNLDYQIDGGAWTTLSAGAAAISNGSYSFSISGPAVGAHSIAVRATGTGEVSPAINFTTVAPAQSGLTAPTHYLASDASHNAYADGNTGAQNVTDGYIDIAIWIAANSYTGETLISRWSGANNNNSNNSSFIMQLDNNGFIITSIFGGTSVSGAYTGIQSTAALPVPTSQNAALGVWARIQINVGSAAVAAASGPVGSIAAGTAVFSYAQPTSTTADGNTWQQFGATVTGLGSGGIAQQSAYGFTFGTLNSSNVFAGNVFKALVRNSAGAIITNPDFTALATGTTSFTDTAASPVPYHVAAGGLI